MSKILSNSEKEVIKKIADRDKHLVKVYAQKLFKYMLEEDGSLSGRGNTKGHRKRSLRKKKTSN
jgi:hypothetical protein